MVRMLPTTALFVLAWQKLRWAVISYVSAGTTLSCKALPDTSSKQRHTTDYGIQLSSQDTIIIRHYSESAVVTAIADLSTNLRR